MPNFLVELPESQTFSQLGQGATKMVIFAADEAGARRAASGRFDGDGNALWDTEASVTELVVGLELADAGEEGWTLYCRISGAVAQDPDPIVAQVDGQTKDQSKGILGKTRLHISSTDITINDGGASNVDDDIWTLVGGTAVRAATFRAIGTGAITSFEVIDPGEYSELPTLTDAVMTNDGIGTGQDIDLAQAVVGGYDALVGQMVTELLAFGLTTSVDMSEIGIGTRLFTISTIGDGIGEAIVEFEVRHHGTEETVLMSTIVDGDTAAAVLTVALAAIPLAPPRIEVFGSFGE